MAEPNATINGFSTARRYSPIDLTTELMTPKDATRDEVFSAVATAKRAQSTWQTYSVDARAARLKEAAKAMLKNRDEITELVTREVGKIPVDALFNEGLGTLDTVKAWVPIVKAHAEKKVALNPIAFPKKRARIVLEPRGVVGVIAPWNYPVAGLYRSLIPALLSGNGVVLKPSEHSPLSSQWFVDQLAQVLPKGLVTVVHGAGEVGQQLLDAPIDVCVFTGSRAVGEIVSVRCAKKGIVFSVELGGNDGAIVLDDCHLPYAVAGVTQWALQNAGQACGAIEVAYVDEKIADRFVAALERAFSDLTVTGSDLLSYDVSPLTTSAQLERVESHIEDALEKGATLVTGGRATETGRFFEPTLLDHCTRRMKVVEEETFGPVLAVVRIRGVEDAISAINSGTYGLTTSIWTKDIVRAERLAERLQVGVVTINNHAFTGAIPSLPWSGRRGTGTGIANSLLSLTTFCAPKVIAIDSGEGPEPFWVPLDLTLLELGNILSDLQINKGLKQAVKLPKLLWQRSKTIKTFFSFLIACHGPGWFVLEELVAIDSW